MDRICECTLWCKRGEKVIKFTAFVGLPRLVGDLWECDWSLGELFPHEVRPAQNMGSMLTLISALRSVVGFLKARCDLGDCFYFDQDLTQHIEDVAEFLWGSYFPHSDDCKPNKGLTGGS